jgi:hypothetical protein
MQGNKDTVGSQADTTDGANNRTMTNDANGASYPVLTKNAHDTDVFRCLIKNHHAARIRRKGVAP